MLIVFHLYMNDDTAQLELRWAEQKYLGRPQLRRGSLVQRLKIFSHSLASETAGETCADQSVLYPRKTKVCCSRQLDSSREVVQVSERTEERCNLVADLNGETLCRLLLMGQQRLVKSPFSETQGAQLS